MPFWQRVAIAAGVFAVVWIIARLVDWWLKRRTVSPEAATRYLVLRRAVTVTILFVGFLSALLVIPQVRAVAGGLLASTAVLGIIVGLASQQVLSNFIAGLVIAVTQPVRIGDRVTYVNEEGTVEEIGLTYTFIRTLDLRRLVVPNSKLASEVIINSSIRGDKTLAEVSVLVPLTADVGAVVEALRTTVAERTGCRRLSRLARRERNGDRSRRGPDRAGGRPPRARVAPARASPTPRTRHLGGLSRPWSRCSPSRRLRRGFSPPVACCRASR